MKPTTPPPTTKVPPVVIRKSHPYPIILSLAASFLWLTHAPLAVAQSDAQIEASARTSYVFRTHLAGDAVTAHARGGQVTLTGKVTEGSHKNLAQDTVSALRGVRSVDNQIEVKGSPADYSDAWLTLKVKGTLAIHQSVSAARIAVQVKDGVVTLSGEAADAAQKQQAADYVEAVGGVKSLKNAMTVRVDTDSRGRTIAKTPANIPVESVDDASVTAQAKMALMSQSAASVANATVTTVGGVLTLSGSAANAAQRDMVSRVVTDINGVKSVVNHMVIGTLGAGS